MLCFGFAYYNYTHPTAISTHKHTTSYDHPRLADPAARCRYTSYILTHHQLGPAPLFRYTASVGQTALGTDPAHIQYGLGSHERMNCRLVLLLPPAPLLARYHPRSAGPAARCRRRSRRRSARSSALRAAVRRRTCSETIRRAMTLGTRRGSIASQVMGLVRGFPPVFFGNGRGLVQVMGLVRGFPPVLWRGGGRMGGG